jgi:hypothetical protein
MSFLLRSKTEEATGLVERAPASGDADPNRRFRDPWFALQVAEFPQALVQIKENKKSGFNSTLWVDR